MKRLILTSLIALAGLNATYTHAAEPVFYRCQVNAVDYLGTDDEQRATLGKNIHAAVVDYGDVFIVNYDTFENVMSPTLKPRGGKDVGVLSTTGGKLDFIRENGAYSLISSGKRKTGYIFNHCEVIN